MERILELLMTINFLDYEILDNGLSVPGIGNNKLQKIVFTRTDLYKKQGKFWNAEMSFDFTEDLTLEDYQQVKKLVSEGIYPTIAKIGDIYGTLHNKFLSRHELPIEFPVKILTTDNMIMFFDRIVSRFSKANNAASFNLDVFPEITSKTWIKDKSDNNWYELGNYLKSQSAKDGITYFQI